MRLSDVRAKSEAMISKYVTQDGIPMTRWQCPVCLVVITVHDGMDPGHIVSGLDCLQRQITSLQETVDAIVTKLGGEL
jgi:hypothetical protein